MQLFIWGDFFFQNADAQDNNSKVNELFSLWKNNANFLSSLCGHFVILMFDQLKEKYLLFNSCFGMMPIYYSIHGKKLFFSSRLQSFIDVVPFNLQFNKCSLLQYLIFNYPIDDSSFLTNVNILPAASVISNCKDNWIVNKYDNHEWLFNTPSYGFDNGKELVDSVFRKTISKYARIISPFGCAITGGFDSRLILSYLRNENAKAYFLFTYGKKSHIDMDIAIKLSKRFGIQHLPVYMDDVFIDNYLNLAKESILLSDGARAANRGHYMLMAREVAEKAKLIISGNCASNILKIVQSPCPVFNKFVLKLFQASGTLDQSADKAYKTFFENNPWISPFVSKEEFVESILQSEIIQDNTLTAGQIFYHYLLTNTERKYFGSETASYASYVYNYSPFIDSYFIKNIVQTPFFGGHYQFLEQSLLVRYKLLVLYAELMLSNDKRLAQFTSARGFPVTWFLTYHGRIVAFVVNKLRKYFFSNKDTDPFNHRKGFQQIFNSWRIDHFLFNKPQEMEYSDEIVKAFSFSFWLAHYDL